MGKKVSLLIFIFKNIYFFVIFSEAFKQFLKDGFDIKEHANKIIQGMAISQQLGKLAEGISLLDKEIHTQVSAWLPHSYR